MSRIRTIKPEFFKHSGLFDLEKRTGLPVRLAFVGLWLCADREGRFKWRPRELKLDILPYDECDFTQVLNALRDAGFVRRYEIDSSLLGFIPSFKRHQTINPREAQSILPPCPGMTHLHTYAGLDTREDLAPDQCARVYVSDEYEAHEKHVHAQGEGKGREGKGRERENPDHALQPNGSPSPAAGFSSPHDEAEMIATAVIDSIGVTTKWGRDQIVRQAEFELKATAATDKPATMDELRNGMVFQWKRYREAVRQGKTKTDMSAEKFFGESRWKNSAEWGLKKGESVDGIVI